MKQVEKLVNLFWNKEFILFIIIGGINSVIAIILSYIYSLLFSDVISFILGYITGTLISYILNSCITFQAQISIKKYMKFIASCIPNFIIQLLIVWLVVDVLKLYKLMGYVLAAAIGMPVTFSILKIYVFIKKDKGRTS